jgi:hypothetical protein
MQRELVGVERGGGVQAGLQSVGPGSQECSSRALGDFGRGRNAVVMALVGILLEEDSFADQGFCRLGWGANGAATVRVFADLGKGSNAAIAELWSRYELAGRGERRHYCRPGVRWCWPGFDRLLARVRSVVGLGRMGLTARTRAFVGWVSSPDTRWRCWDAETSFCQGSGIGCDLAGFGELIIQTFRPAAGSGCRGHPLCGWQNFGQSGRSIN